VPPTPSGRPVGLPLMAVALALLIPETPLRRSVRETEPVAA
jgi:hypothetical protein